METVRTFTVEILGFTPQLVRQLACIGRLTAGRPRCFEFVEAPRQRPDIVIVDADNPDGLDAWRLAHADRGTPTIFCSRTGECPAGHHTLKPPLVPTRLLGQLDEIAANKLVHLPGLKIGETEQQIDPNVVVPKVGGGIRALVVDDSATVRKQMELCLSSQGLSVTLCENGEQALEAMTKARYGIVFLDVVMPGIDGYQVCKAIKKDNAQKKTPVVMLTSKSSPFDKIKGSFAGCDSYLTKPVDNDTLLTVLTQYLGDSQSWYLNTPRASTS